MHLTQLQYEFNEFQLEFSFGVIVVISMLLDFFKKFVENKKISTIAMRIVQGAYVGDARGFPYQDTGHALRLCHILVGMGMSENIRGTQ